MGIELIVTTIYTSINNLTKKKRKMVTTPVQNRGSVKNSWLALFVECAKPLNIMVVVCTGFSFGHFKVQGPN